jgi:hypothetical protein
LSLRVPVSRLFLHVAHISRLPRVSVRLGKMSQQPERTLGGVKKQQFLPNISASRNKKEKGGSTFDRLLQSEEQPIVNPGAGSSSRDRRAQGTSSQQQQQQQQQQQRDGHHNALPSARAPANEGSSSSAAGRRSGGDGGGGGDGGEAQAVKMETDDLPGAGGVSTGSLSRADSAIPLSDMSDIDQKAWLLEPDAPLALPLRPTPSGICYGASSRTGSRAPSRAPSRAATSCRATPTRTSRPASRAAPSGADSPEVAGLGKGATARFPPESPAAALFGAAEPLEPDIDEADAPGDASPFFFFQLPTSLPLKAADEEPLNGFDSKNVMSKSEYLAALAGSATASSSDKKDASSRTSGVVASTGALAPVDPAPDQVCAHPTASHLLHSFSQLQVRRRTICTS